MTDEEWKKKFPQLLEFCAKWRAWNGQILRSHTDRGRGLLKASGHSSGKSGPVIQIDKINAFAALWKRL